MREAERERSGPLIVDFILSCVRSPWEVNARIMVRVEADCGRRSDFVDADLRLTRRN